MNVAADLPGAELISSGIDDLGRGVESIASLLVSIGAPRLHRIGFDLPDRVFPDAERRLYERLASESPGDAHSRYNALIRRLISFEQAAECASPSTRRD